LQESKSVIKAERGKDKVERARWKEGWWEQSRRKREKT